MSAAALRARSSCGRVVAALAIVALGGCASPSASLRTLPPENPAAENAAAAESAAAFTAASAGGVAETAPGENGAPATAASTAPPVKPEDAPPMRTYDPWERFNRFSYRFNARFDEAVFLPVANAYRRVPPPLRTGVHNFFGNLAEIDSVINYTLQGRLGLGARSLGRLAINSTIGIGGLIDVATKLKLPGAPTGLGRTLARWGVHPGPYLVIPILGPSTLRDGLGFAGDYATTYVINVADLYRSNAAWGLGVLNAVDQRSNVSFRYYASGSPFEYENVRFLYVHKTLIEDDAARARGSHPQPREHNSNEPAGK
ncbi:MAG TPA: VacJ family lipoprotein [Steroidobacteraceae bacterium]|jgi:phospholipid-binding lipoprotein MlaA|nr:VacJ family lipoprotein [Steroidobacteraceae bacterium]